MSELRRRLKKLEEATTPKNDKHIFFWKGKETDKELAKLSPEERIRAIVFQWQDNSDLDVNGPI